MTSPRPAPKFSASVIERKLREAESAAEGPSLLQELFEQVERDSRWHISFSDLCGLAERLPDLRLPVIYQLHGCDFCAFAKSDSIGLRDCVRNKHAVNRIGLRRATGFLGQCHLGITDLIEPLILKDQVMGLFMLGSVVLVEGEGRSRAQLLRHCCRRNIDPDELLLEWDKLPRVTHEEVQDMRQRLRLIARITARLAEAWGAPTGFERPGRAGALWDRSRHFPETLRRALALLQTRYAEPIQLGDLASEVGVTADHLGSLFRQHTHGTLNDQLTQLRISHACRLLQSGRHTAGEVALLTGFADQAHFGKVFKKQIGLTPGTFTRQMMA